ncbi:MAG: hypothetical protein Q8Q63_04880 [Phaeovulum sp.]|jgi:predicted transcriptional regulator|uniref:hypothetical protein n=1 Tax=Phaeovulum sp. TaxID=2934796 RepID=UPI00272F7EBA|nr:hypothetical protein [Phaeovulum sp.]MDP2063239.1 hypothetical protein [Phaeovulum sp.]MDP3860901.1 hypothetical protein [Phaeovulum sp.]
MTALLAEKHCDTSKLSSEAALLHQLQQQASEINRMLEEGKITQDEAARQLNQLTIRNIGFRYRIFGV